MLRWPRRCYVCKEPLYCFREPLHCCREPLRCLQGAGERGKLTWAWRMLSVMRVPPQPASVPSSTGPKMVPGYSSHARLTY